MTSGGSLRAPLRAFALCIALGLSVASAVTALADAPNDPGFSQQWALTGSLASIHAPQAWCANLGDVLVADVDTGADFRHPDLAGKLVAGAAFLKGDGSQSGTGPGAVQDDNSHGTMTTGIMVANTNNGVGVSAVAPASRALIVKVLKSDGSGNANDVAAGIRYAAAYPGVKVINLSIGSDVPPVLGITAALQNPVLGAINDAYHKYGVLVVAASGNKQDTKTDYGSVAAYTLVAGALKRDGTQASYSSPGSNVNAPGGDVARDANGNPTEPLSTANSILSTDPGSTGYAIGIGTSFAAPMVAGTAAMLAARGMSAADIYTQIKATEVGGQLDSAGALGRAPNGPVCPPAATGTPPPGGGGIAVRSTTPPKRTSGTSTIRPAQPAAPVALATPTSNPSPSPTTVATPTATPEDTMPSPRTLAHPPATPPGKGPPPALIVGGVAAVGAAGFGLFKLLPLVR